MAQINPEDPVRVIMSAPVASIEANATLADLAGLLTVELVGAVTIMNGDQIEGIVSERDIVRALAAGASPDDVWAADVMTTEPITFDLDEPIANVAERMLDEGVRHMPVVSGGRVVGIVSERDVLHVLSAAWRRTQSPGARQAATE